MKILLLLCRFLAMLVLLALPASAVDPFTKVTTIPVLTAAGNADGCAWGDFNNDGFQETSAQRRRRWAEVYRNNGAGSFVQVTSDAVVSGNNFWRA